MEDDDDAFVVEEREELMVSGDDEFLKTAHFLTPSVATSVAAPATAPAAKCKHLPLKVVYHGWKRPPENWISWIDQLHSSHHSTWKRAGIFDAIIASKCIIPRCDHLILELVEKWCPRTNSFVFPWGETSITLEDIMVLGGYPVLGESVLIPPENEEMEETVKKLETARSEIVCSSRSRNAANGKWIAQFKGSASEIEHAAFLTFWLSRFVFPSSRSTICRRVIPIAVHLANGTKIALAPTLLATVYKSITILKAAIILAQKSKKSENLISEILQVAVPAPLAYLQVWIWERFPSVRPMLMLVGKTGPRLARWDRVKLGSEYRSMSIDSIGKDFQWRPYATSYECNGLVYQENERWEMVDSDLDEDLQGFVRCIRTCDLASLEGDCMEQYLPHRVAMQFGMDQDIPGEVERINVSREAAWKRYTRLIRDEKLYVPARLSQPHVSSQYLVWWRSDVVGAKGKKGEEKQDLFGRKSEADVLSSPPPGFSLAWKKVQKGKGKQIQDGVQRKSTLCSFNCGKGCSKGLKNKLSMTKFVGSSSSRGKRSDCNNSNPCRPKRRGKFVENSSGKTKSSKRKRKVAEILLGEKSNGGKGCSQSSRKKRNVVVMSSGDESDRNSISPPPGFAPLQSREEADQSDRNSIDPPPGFSPQQSWEAADQSDRNSIDPPPGFSPQQSWEAADQLDRNSIDPPPGFAPQQSREEADQSDRNSIDPPPGFAPQQSREEADQSDCNSIDPPPDFAPQQCREEADRLSSTVNVEEVEAVAPTDEQTKSLEERIGIVEKLVAFIQAGKLVCL